MERIFCPKLSKNPLTRDVLQDMKNKKIDDTLHIEWPWEMIYIEYADQIEAQIKGSSCPRVGDLCLILDRRQHAGEYFET